MMKILYALIFPALLLAASVHAAGNETTEAAQERGESEYHSMLEEAERTRMEAEAAREDAVRVAQMAREASLREAELAREEAELAREASHTNQVVREEMQRERAAQREELAKQREIQQADMARAREELGRAHRELRTASREVARAHRDLAQTNQVRQTVRVVNLGDRAVIGVIMGPETDEGVKLIGVSPDGPAERAGLQQGDVLVSIAGEVLAASESPREVVYQVMADTTEGEELAVTVIRGSENLEYTVTPEVREPSSWQSLVRIPEVEHVASAHGEHNIVIKHIEVPELNTVEIDAQLDEVREQLKTMKYNYTFDEDNILLEVEEFSDLAGEAFRSADVWFGMPHTQGLELASINEGLGEYFKTDRGVLVIKAREDNAYQLKSGDVILAVDSTPVNSPADMMRVLRELEPGDDIELEIKRDRRNRTLSVVMPENRLGYHLNSHPH